MLEFTIIIRYQPLPYTFVSLNYTIRVVYGMSLKESSRSKVPSICLSDKIAVYDGSKRLKVRGLYLQRLWVYQGVWNICRIQDGKKKCSGDSIILWHSGRRLMSLKCVLWVCFVFATRFPLCSCYFCATIKANVNQGCGLLNKLSLNSLIQPNNALWFYECELFRSWFKMKIDVAVVTIR